MQIRAYHHFGTTSKSLSQKKVLQIAVKCTLNVNNQPVFFQQWLPGAAWWRQVSVAFIHSSWCFFYCLYSRTITIGLFKYVARNNTVWKCSVRQEKQEEGWAISVMHHFLSYDEYELWPSGWRYRAPPLQTSLSRLRFFVFSLMSNVCLCQSSRHRQVKSDECAIRSGLSLDLWECLTPLLSPPYSTVTVHRCSLCMHLH